MCDMQFLVILLFLLFSTILYTLHNIKPLLPPRDHTYKCYLTPKSSLDPSIHSKKAKTLATLPINLFGETTNIWRGDFFTNSHPPPDRVNFGQPKCVKHFYLLNLSKICQIFLSLVGPSGCVSKNTPSFTLNPFWCGGLETLRGVKQCKSLSQKWFPACHVQHAIVSHFAILVVLDPFILYTFHNMKLGQFWPLFPPRDHTYECFLTQKSRLEPSIHIFRKSKNIAHQFVWGNHQYTYDGGFFSQTHPHHQIGLILVFW